MTTIRVTSEHIAAGEKGSCQRCPVALALHDAGVVEPYVGPAYMAFTVDRSRKMQRTPDAVVAFFSKFDNGETVEPFSFEWEPTYRYDSGEWVELARRTALELLLLHGTPIGGTVVLASGETVRRVA